MQTRTSRETGEGEAPKFARFAVQTAFLTNAGRVRENNEDSGCVVVPEDGALLVRRGVLMIVADGMGGHQGGELASRLAVQWMCERYYANDAAPQRALLEGIDAANREIYALSRREQKLAGMGTTCTAVSVVNGLAWVAHVGDSRVYLIRGGGSYRMTQDHSLTMDLVNRGVITLAEADQHEDRNVILRAVGTHEKVEASTWQEPFPLRAGDSLVLCSDGLYQSIDDDEFAAVCDQHSDCETACAALLNLAMVRDGSDNITIAMLRLAEVKES